MTSKRDTANGETSEGAVPVDAELNTGRIPDPEPAHTPLFRWMARALLRVEAALRARGGERLRGFLRVFWALVGAAGLFLLFGPVINPPMDLDEVIESADVGEVDWIATDTRIDYRVSRDDDGAFAVRVSERFTANFVNDPVDRVRRTLPVEFRGNAVGPAGVRAEIDGEAAEVARDDRLTLTTLSIAPPGGGELSGAHEVRLEYELRHLAVPETDAATGTPVDLFEWDLFAAAWPQGVKGIEASVTLPRELDEALIRQPRVDLGWLIVSGGAWLDVESQTADSVTYEFSNDDTLPPHAYAVVDFGFERGTFAMPEHTPLFTVQTFGPLVPLALLLLALPFALAARGVAWADARGEPWFTASSEPPRRLSAETAAHLVREPRLSQLAEALAGAPRRGAPQPDGPRRRGLFGRAARGGGSGGARSGGGRGRAAAAREHSRQHVRRRRWLQRVARAAERTGRVGALPRALAHYAASPAGRRVFEQGLRRVPEGYVRDAFIWAPIALTAVQWGLVRQLSHQVVLSVVWWPVAFVLGSTLLAAVVVGIALSAKPLTRKGALAVQRLRGIDVYARQTRLLDRGPVDDPLLPYAVLFESPRRARGAVRGLAEEAAREYAGPGGRLDLHRGWRGPGYVSPPAVLASATGVLLLAGSIVTAAVLPPPYEPADPFTRFESLPGTLWAQVEGFDIAAELTGDGAGGARLDVVERKRVNFTPVGSSVPQYMTEWPAERLGQDLGLEFVSMTVDGEEAPVQQRREGQGLVVATQLREVLDGLHDVEVRYALTTPVVDAVDFEGPLQELRWTALHSFWEDTYYTDPASPFDGSAPVRPLRVQLAIAPEIAELVRSGGWIDRERDHDSRRVPLESGNWYGPWSHEGTMYSDAGDGFRLQVGSERTLGDGTRVYAIDVDEVEMVREDRSTVDGAGASRGAGEPVALGDPARDGIGRYELGLSSRDLGVRLAFEPGTFAGVDAGAAERFWSLHELPYRLTLGLGGLVLAGSALVWLLAVRRKGGIGASFTAVSFVALPAAMIAQCVLFGWAVGFMPGSDERIPLAMVVGGAMFVLVVAQGIVVGRRRAAVRSEAESAGATGARR